MTLATDTKSTHAISSEFSDYYNDVGKFTVVLPMDEYNIGIVELDAVLYIVERKLDVYGGRNTVRLR